MLTPFSLVPRLPLCIWVGRESGRSSQHFCPSSGMQVAGVGMQIRRCWDYENLIKGNMNIITTGSLNGDGDSE